jgi:hypothetical protein
MGNISQVDFEDLIDVNDEITKKDAPKESCDSIEEIY